LLEAANAGLRSPRAFRAVVRVSFRAVLGRRAAGFAAAFAAGPCPLRRLLDADGFAFRMLEEAFVARLACPLPFLWKWLPFEEALGACVPLRFA